MCARHQEIFSPNPPCRWKLAGQGTHGARLHPQPAADSDEGSNRRGPRPRTSHSTPLRPGGPRSPRQGRSQQPCNGGIRSLRPRSGEPRVACCRSGRRARDSRPSRQNCCARSSGRGSLSTMRKVSATDQFRAHRTVASGHPPGARGLSLLVHSVSPSRCISSSTWWRLVTHVLGESPFARQVDVQVGGSAARFRGVAGEVVGCQPGQGFADRHRGPELATAKGTQQ